MNKTEFEPADPNFDRRIRESFRRQQAMATFHAAIHSVAPGSVEIDFEHHESLTQQHGFLHGGVVASVLDSACGYSALTLMPADREVVTVEYKINLLRPATARAFRAVGQVVSAGKRLVVVSGTAYALLDSVSAGPGKAVASMLATMMPVDPGT